MNRAIPVTFVAIALSACSPRASQAPLATAKDDPKNQSHARYSMELAPSTWGYFYRLDTFTGEIQRCQTREIDKTKWKCDVVMEADTRVPQ